MVGLEDSNHPTRHLCVLCGSIESGEITMNSFIDRVVEPGLFWLADWSLRWAILLTPLALGLVLPWSRRLPASARYQVCLLALAVGLVLPFLPRWGAGFWSEAAPVLTVADNTRDQLEKPAPIADDLDAEIPRRADAPTLATTGAVPVIQPRRADAPTLASRSSQSEPAPSSAAPPIHSPPWQGGAGGVILSRTLACFYLLAVGFLLLRWVAGCIYLSRLRRSAQPVKDAAPLLDSCSAALGLRRRVLLCEHPAVRSPVALGPRRPTILVPPDWSKLPEDLRRSSLTHELAHLARRDDWLAVVVLGVRTMFFFHPWVLWLTRRLQREAEILCDQAALATGVGVQEYAALLLDYAGRGGRVTAVALPFGGKTVKSRINHILESTMTAKPSGRRTVFALIAGLSILAISLGAGSLRLRALADEPKPKDGEQTQKKDSPAEKLEVIDLPQIKSRVDVVPIGDQGLALVVVEGEQAPKKPAGKEKADRKEQTEPRLEFATPKLEISEKPQIKSADGKPIEVKEGPPSEVFTVSVRNFRIPFGIPEDQKDKVHELQLMMSSDEGKTWSTCYTRTIVKPDDKWDGAVVTVPADGIYWFKLFTIDKEGNRSPASWRRVRKILVRTEPAGTGVKKEDLTFDGKFFDQWKSSLLTELNPLRRAEAISALAAFGANGYGVEAVKPILETVRADLGSDSVGAAPVFDSGRNAMARIGTAAVPELVQQLKNADVARRLMAVNFLSHMGTKASAAGPELLKALDDKDPDVRRNALSALKNIQPKGDEYAAAYVKIAKDFTTESDTEKGRLAVTALEALTQMGPAARSAVPGLVELLDAALKNPERDANSVHQAIMWLVIRAIGKIGGRPDLVVPALAKVVKDATAMQVIASRYQELFPALAQYGTDAKPAVPAVLHFVSGRSPATFNGAFVEGYLLPSELDALIKMGADPKVLVPLVRKTIRFRRQELTGGQYTRLQEFLKKYD